MSTETSKEIVGDFFGRLSNGDLEGALAMLADDLTWWIAGKPASQPAGGLHDKAWIAGLFQRMAGQIEGPMRMTVEGLVAEGDRVAAEVKGHGRLRDGRVYENEYHFALEIRDGRIAAVREYLDTQHVVATWFQRAPEPPAIAATAVRA